MAGTNREERAAIERAKAFAGLAEALARAEAVLGLLSADVDPAIAAEIGWRLAAVREELDWLRGKRSADAADAIAPFRLRFVQSGDSGGTLSR